MLTQPLVQGSHFPDARQSSVLGCVCLISGCGRGILSPAFVWLPISTIHTISSSSVYFLESWSCSSWFLGIWYQVLHLTFVWAAIITNKYDHQLMSHSWAFFVGKNGSMLRFLAWSLSCYLDHQSLPMSHFLAWQKFCDREFCHYVASWQFLHQIVEINIWY